MEAKVYNKEGKENGSIKLDQSVFDLSWNGDLVHDTVNSLLSSKRTPVAHTKDRGEVRGGGRKPWQQKGTGRARHGSSRSPIWVGGGVTHGPRNEKNYDRKVNKKVKSKALGIVLSKKQKDGEIIFIDDLSFKSPKTKEAISIVSNLSKIKGAETLKSKKKNVACIVSAKKDGSLEKSFANMNGFEVIEARNINILDALKYKHLIIENPKVSVDLISARVKAK